MMKQLSSSELEALRSEANTLAAISRLKESGDFKVLLSFIRKNAEAMTSELVHSNDTKPETVSTYRSVIKYLYRLLDYIETSDKRLRTVLDALESQQPQNNVQMRSAVPPENNFLH